MRPQHTTDAAPASLPLGSIMRTRLHLISTLRLKQHHETSETDRARRTTVRIAHATADGLDRQAKFLKSEKRFAEARRCEREAAKLRERNPILL